MNMTTDEVKSRAKRLRSALADLKLTVSHGQALDLLARLEGLPDWNTLSARVSPEIPIGPLPQGWVRSGDQPERFDMGRAMRDAESAAAIRLKAGEPSGNAFGTLMQTVEAASYRGKRVALDASIAADRVTGAVTIWMRADSAAKATLAFDNLESAARGKDSGPISGTQDWTIRRVVLDIPEAAETLHFGFYLRGGGTAWCKDVALAHAPEAELSQRQSQPRGEPQNLSFAE